MKWNRRFQKAFQKALKRANILWNDPERLQKLLDKATKLPALARGSLQQISSDIKTLSRMVRAYMAREYTDVPLKTILAVVAAILYLVNPFDIIPDFIVGVGYIDDATVFGYVLKSFKGDIDKFKDWENGRGSEGSPA